MDSISKQQRSWNMSRIRSKNTTPELIVRSYLHRKGFRFCLHDSRLPGKPDIVLPKYRTIVFVHGCFWHGHGRCKYFTIPKTRTEWWRNKISKNKLNDQKNLIKLKKMGWKVVIIWECEINNPILLKKKATIRRF